MTCCLIANKWHQQFEGCESDRLSSSGWPRCARRRGDRITILSLRCTESGIGPKRLVAAGLIEQTFATQDKPSYCVNRDCHLRFKLERNRQYCRNCGEHLLAGQTVMQPTVNEQKTTRYIASKLSAADMIVEIFSKKLLGRALNVASVSVGNSSVEIIPLTGNITPSQMELLRLRLPNAFILTSRDNVTEYTDQDVECQDLHKFVLLLEKGEHQEVATMLQEVSRHGLERMRRCARVAAERFEDAQYYRTKNLEKKNLGAELFEAHTHLHFNYMFKNSVWLGATKRGSAVPDGISAFPVLTAGGIGCVLWDVKYSDGKVGLGSHKKNKVYIDAARKNSSIRGNGGLRGFVFVGNQRAPGTFEKRYKKLGGARTPKIVYLTAAQLLAIVRHFRDNEADILGNVACDAQFMQSMSVLLMSVTGGHKATAVNDAELSKILHGFWIAPEESAELVKK
jgi:hypothetical protein